MFVRRGVNVQKPRRPTLSVPVAHRQHHQQPSGLQQVQHLRRLHFLSSFPFRCHPSPRLRARSGVWERRGHLAGYQFQKAPQFSFQGIPGAIAILIT